MFQLLIDHSDINTLTALYISIYFGISLKYLWAWSVEYSFMDSLSNQTNTKIIHRLFLYNKTNQLKGSFILKRIIMFIRKKEYIKDDSEEDPISFLSSSY